MSDDLISRKFLLECAEYDDKWRLVIPYEKVKNAPTAFDKEKVIDNLENLKNNLIDCNDLCGECLEIECDQCALKKAIEIVEKGGIEFLH